MRSVRLGLVSEKKAYTPAEFAALFGREKTWAYRMLYAGKINGISDYGRMMIPASEATRIEGEATRYRGKKKAAKKVAEEKPKKATGAPPAKGSASWTQWVEKRRNKASKAKGVGGQAKPVPRVRRKIDPMGGDPP